MLPKRPNSAQMARKFIAAETSVPSDSIRKDERYCISARRLAAA